MNTKVTVTKGDQIKSHPIASLYDATNMLSLREHIRHWYFSHDFNRVNVWNKNTNFEARFYYHALLYLVDNHAEILGFFGLL